MKASRLFLLLHTPTEIARPLQMGLVRAEPWSQALFAEYAAEVEESRKRGHSCSMLTKRSIERWGFNPPCGARVQVVEISLPDDLLK